VEVEKGVRNVCIAEHDVTENTRNRLFKKCVPYTWHKENDILLTERELCIS
jgi:hypothetical protein